MTREEAIFYIKELQKTYASMDKKVAEATDMAIEALNFEEYGLTCKTCADRNMCVMSAPDGQWKACEDYRPLADADMVSVVRCKDCKWYMLTDHNETEVCTNKQWDISMAIYPIISADGFCSYGERREP